MPAFLIPLVQLAVATAARTILGQVAVLALWEIACRTPGEVDDEAVKSIAKSLGVELPKRAKGPKKPPQAP